MNTHVLIAFDGSEQATRAIDKATEFFGNNKDALIDIICSIPYGAGSGAKETSPMFPLNGLGNYFCDQTDIADSIAAAKNEAITNMTERLAPRFANCACDIKYTAVVGSNIAEGIADYAEEANVDLIIMGCRGLGAVRAAIGSVSQAVLRQVPMPVMLLK